MTLEISPRGEAWMTTIRASLAYCVHPRVVRYCAYPLLAWVLAACDRIIPVERVEISRVPSQERGIDAVLVRTNGGATTGFVFEVFVVPGEGDWNQSDSAVLAFDRTDQLEIRWEDEQRLSSVLRGGRVLHFRSSKHVSTEAGTLRGDPIATHHRGGCGVPIHEVRGESSVARVRAGNPT